MRYVLDTLTAIHGLWIACCAMLGAFFGMASPFLLLGWVLLMMVTP